MTFGFHLIFALRYRVIPFPLEWREAISPAFEYVSFHKNKVEQAIGPNRYRFASAIGHWRRSREEGLVAARRLFACGIGLSRRDRHAQRPGVHRVPVVVSPSLVALSHSCFPPAFVF
jgi:hypothetical protein